MSEAVVDFSELTDYTKQLIEDLQTNFPKEYDRFLKSEARRISKRIRDKAPERFQTITGNFLKGTKVGKVYTFGETRSIRAYGGSPAKHTHLLEGGHIVKKRGADKVTKRLRKKTSPYYSARKAARATYAKPGIGGRTRAFYSYLRERELEASEFSKSFEKFYGKLLSGKRYS